MNTEDREVLRRNFTIRIVRLPDGFTFACPWCAFNRRFETESGALTRVAEHASKHGKRLTLERKPR